MASCSTNEQIIKKGKHKVLSISTKEIMRKISFKRASVYLIIISADGAARRKLCAGGLWGFRCWPSLTGDGKCCPLVTVQGDDASGFVDHVMHAVFLQPTA